VSSTRRVNREKLRRLPGPVRHYCPIHRRYYVSFYEPAPCRACEPVLFDELYPLRKKARTSGTKRSQ